MPVYLLSDELIFPDPNDAEPSGLIAIGGDLSFERLILAYKTGIFPWYSEGDPILWFSPDPRLVSKIEDYKPGKSIKKELSAGKFDVRADTDFESVIKSCAKVRRQDQSGTWITGEMIDAYTLLHQRGYAHSIEVFSDGDLVGGLYGISLGRAFFGESMFHIKTNASKVAFHYLVNICDDYGFDFIDCQLPTDHLKSLGAREISRRNFLKMLEQTLQHDDKIGNWEI